MPTVLDIQILGETSETAHRGDHGKLAYDHSQISHAPSDAQKNSDITKEEIEAKLVGEIGSHTHAIAGLHIFTPGSDIYKQNPIQVSDNGPPTGIPGYGGVDSYQTGSEGAWVAFRMEHFGSCTFYAEAREVINDMGALRFYRNGVQVGVSFGIGTSFVGFSQVISFAPGDVLTAALHAYETSYLQNCRILVTKPVYP